ncbi:MAG: hypothetical protein R3Y43_02960 [Alphaproteobacteria bacterium]
MKLKKVKKKLSKFLPQKIDNVLDKYDDFSNQDILSDAKSFHAHHSACKTAITHIHSLLKLAETTEAQEAATPIPAFDIEAILKEANDNFEEEE